MKWIFVYLFIVLIKYQLNMLAVGVALPVGRRVKEEHQRMATVRSVVKEGPWTNERMNE